MIGTTLVTGGNGFAGRHLLQRLEGQSPIVAWRRPGRQDVGRSGSIEWRNVDLLDRVTVDHELQRAKPARIFHLAGAPQLAAAWATAVPHLQANVLGTHHLLDAVRRAGRPCRMVIVTSAQVYDTDGGAPISEDTPLKPNNPYGFSKLAQDELARRACEDDDLDVIVARPFNHVGPGQDPAFAIASFARQVALAEAGMTEPVIRVGNLETRRDITDVRDVVTAYQLMMVQGHRGRAYNVASGEGHRMRDLLDTLIAGASKPLAVEVDSSRLRPNDSSVIVGDATRAATELGWTPKIPIRQTLLDTLAWWRREIQSGRN